MMSVQQRVWRTMLPHLSGCLADWAEIAFAPWNWQDPVAQQTYSDAWQRVMQFAVTDATRYGASLGNNGAAWARWAALDFLTRLGVLPARAWNHYEGGLFWSTMNEPLGSMWQPTRIPVMGRHFLDKDGTYVPN